MKKKLSTKELVLVVILLMVVVALAFYKLYLTPLQAKIENFNSLADTEQIMLDTNTTIAMDMRRMESFIEEKKNDGETHAIPFYDNTLTLMNELNKTLSQTDSFSLNFGSTSADNYLVRRPVSLSYTCADYESARAILDQLNDSDNVNQITDLSVNLGDEAVTMSMTIIYYEVQP